MGRASKCVLQTVLLTVLLSAVFVGIGSFLVDRMKLPHVFWIILIVGCLGGLVESLIRNERKFILSEFTVEAKPSGLGWAWGSLADVVIGAGGSLTLMFLFSGNLLNFDFAEPSPKPQSLILLTSLSFVGGVVGRRLIESAGERLTRAAKQAEEAKGLAGTANSTSLTLAARQERKAGNLKIAAGLIDQAIRLDSLNAMAHLEKGMIMRRLAQSVTPTDRRQLELAFEHAKRAAEIRPESDVPWYNMACYLALLGKDLSEALRYLKRSVDLESDNRRLAWKDEDLASVRGDPEFLKIVGPQQSALQ